ncbi:MAG: hypothetical protein GVY04_07930 [Cyanobacteria bacterium]|jgi:hypothetical protein|nr:hypothetical protein [Cyanobacteria bacterium GSL.Bin1]
MFKTKWLCLTKAISYEFDYLARKFQLIQALIFFVFLIVLVIISLGDTQSFFIGEDSPIPDEWILLKDKNIATFISITVIISSYVLPWLSSFLASREEAKEISVAVQENVIPAVNIELIKLRDEIVGKFNLDGTVRISVFIPVRQGFLQWAFRIVCYTYEIRPKELKARLDLNEGVIGYTFLRNQKHCIEFIDVSPNARLPASYKPLSGENSTLINRDIQAVLVAAMFEEGSVAGLLAIDTYEIDNIPKMEDNLLHDTALDWVIERSNVIRLIWRVSNDI